MDDYDLVDVAMWVACYLEGLSLNLGYILSNCIIRTWPCIDSKLLERELVARLSKVLTFNK